VDARRISAQPLFAGLTDDELAFVAEHADEVEVEPGATLTVEGEFGYSFFVVEDGTAKVAQDGETVGMLGPGDFFGEIGLLVTGRRTATVECASPMRVLAFFDQDFRRMDARLPHVTERIRAAMAERFGTRAASAAG
jgi:CRP-like cAMP-binding protein